MDAGAFRGIGTFLVLGFIFSVLLCAFLPPLVVWGAWWLMAPRLHYVEPNLLWIIAGWFICCALLTVYGMLSAHASRRRAADQWQEFMVLRDQFCKRDEVCLDTLEQLRARAACRSIQGLKRYG